MEIELSNYCPHWIISVITAQSGIDFLLDQLSFAIAKKYSRGLSEHYETDKFSIYMQAIAEEKLRTLSEIEAAENAVSI